jgi:bifunctional non-homologous end joining protein LigD
MAFFVLHEHHARTLHYDFRLEMGGVLKSWTVPKGPSMSPQDRRLAIMVDDHTLDYGAYEGIIPEGLYGAGAVLIRDSGEYELRQNDPAKGKIEILLHGNIFKGLFVLARLKDKEKEWLLIKKRDVYALPSFSLKPGLTEEKRKTLKLRVPPCATGSEDH